MPLSGGVIYIVTAVVSIAVGLFLAFYSRLGGHKEMKDVKRGSVALGVTTDESLKQAVREEIKDLVGSRHRSEEISKRIAATFSKELERKINQNREELSKKYEGIMKEKAQEEQVAWKKYKKILADKKQTEAVIHSITEGLVVVDAEGKVVMMNPAAEKLLGSDKKEKVGKSILENLKEEELVSLVKDAPDKEGKEIELISQQEETKKILRASSAVVEDENGQTVGMVSVLSDITKQKELDSLKSNFVANVSHELRTPLASVEKSLSLILDRSASEDPGADSGTNGQLLSIAQRNLKRLSVLIDDLLDLSKFEAGKMELKREPTSIEKMVNEAVENLDSWAKSKSVKIVKEIQEGLPDVNVDPNKANQVLNNLIGNAIKFTPNDGTITVEVILRKAKGEAEISIQDTGVGIVKEDIAKVFDRFYQSGERALTDISGTGIGLSLSKEIVELHGGRIWAESEKGHGARFVFTLPLTEGQ